MSDSVAKRGRPRLETRPKLSCLKQKSDQSTRRFMNNNTVWHKNADSFRGLKIEREVKIRPNILHWKEMKENQNWIIYNDIVLREGDRDMINQNEWISDSIVNASQSLLQKQFPHISGLQNVLLFEINANKEIDWNHLAENKRKNTELTEKRRQLVPKIQDLLNRVKLAAIESELNAAETDLVNFQNQLKICDQELAKCKVDIEIEGLKPLKKGSKFVQILLDRTFCQNHWICVSNIRTNDFKTIQIYDSDLKRINYSIENYSVYLMTSLKRLFSYDDNIRIELPLVCQSDDHKSGGVYAIAFAQTLCAGLSPSQILFAIPKVMRDHLSLCLYMGTIREFPTAKHSAIDKTADIWRAPKVAKKAKKKKSKETNHFARYLMP